MITFMLSEEQTRALELLQSGENVFLTGGAGSGKSYLIRHFMKTENPKDFPVLASTGAAAVLLGGRTFHSFFGLGIMEGGATAALEKGLRDAKLMKRLARVEGVVIDEISMISGEALQVAERLAQVARESQLPWGGLRVIAVGDFAQLPPVAKSGQKRDWAFKSQAWQRTDFQNCLLSHNQRIQESEFLDVLADVRIGQLTERARNFLSERTLQHDEDDPAPRLFPRREQAEQYNLRRLSEISEDQENIPTIYFGQERQIEYLKKTSPVPLTLQLKKGCQVLFLQNDPQKKWVNGTRGTVEEIQADKIIVKKTNRRVVEVEKVSFSLQDAEGNVVASAIQFPVILAYATTIHKSQGATLDDLWCDLGALWEPGQAYVAMSRLTSAHGLKITRWSPRSIVTDSDVLHFYSNLHPVNLAT